MNMCTFILRQNILDIKELQMYSTFNRIVLYVVSVYGGTVSTCVWYVVTYNSLSRSVS